MFGQVYELFNRYKVRWIYNLGVHILYWYCDRNSDILQSFRKKRLSVDPTPMEVEMRLYENDIQTTLVETYSRKEKELDVGEKHMSGTTGI